MVVRFQPKALLIFTHSRHNIAIVLCIFSKICGNYSATYLAGTSA